MQTRSLARTRNLLFSLTVLATCLAPARAGIEDRDNRNPTAAYWAYNVSVATMQSVISQGNRVVSMKVVATSPTLLTIAYVPNSGTYAKTWWWAVDYTPTSLGTLIANNKARLTDLEVYTVGGSVRMAALMELNTGTNSKGWWWYYGTTTTFIYSEASRLGARVVDLEQYVEGTTTKYAAVLLHNSGQDAKSWWSYLNVTSSYVTSRLAANGARIWDIDRIGTDRYNVTMVKFTGEYCWYFWNLSASAVTDTLSQYGGRLIDIHQYSTTSGTRFDIVLVNSSNALSRRVADLMLGKSDGFSGTYLRRVTTTSSATLAYINGDKRFEPASTLKTLHLVHTMRDIYVNGTISLNSPLTVTTTTSATNSCPFATTPFSMTAQNVLQGMMRASDNALTKVVTDRYGMTALNSTAAALGMSNTRVNHHIGC
ncbi:MAG: serine hydrolase, partial [Planctomycetes bacterium]|nr:serine hydrolase [Planctomycetota bacterium]